MKKFFALSSVLFILSSFAATNEDVNNAQFLADQGIIVKQSTTAGYRLDNTITRAELVGIALKLKGVNLPSYQCKGYFSDVRNNDWICRAVELAADSSLVTRANAKFRPQDNITRAEALAIIMKGGNINIELFNRSYFSRNWVGYSDVYWTDHSQFTADWQRDVFFSYMKNVNLDIPGQIKMPPSDSGHVTFNYRVNSSATRAEVFGFARNVLSNNTATISLDRFGLQLAKNIFFELDSTYASNGIYTLLFGTKREVCTNGCKQEYPQLYIREKKMSITDELAEVLYGEFKGIKNINGVMYLHYISQEMCEGNNYVAFSDKYIFSFTYICRQDTFLQDSAILNFDDTYEFNHKDVLKVYYALLNNAEKGTDYLRNQAYIAYKMRSPSGISSETFHSWYKNVTSVVFREDTIKNLGDNTYEFLVDMTENGVKSTYKVKSKVNLENFTIDNISSVKQ